MAPNMALEPGAALSGSQLWRSFVRMGPISQRVALMLFSFSLRSAASVS